MIKHAFTTRKDGDMKDSVANRERIVHQLFGDARELKTAPQTHSNEVGLDAIISKDKNVALGVFVADCVPILLSDDRAIGAIHAGWKGTLGGITINTINEMKKAGTEPNEMMVWIGPHIGMCHYDVPESRAQKFLNTFDNDPKVASFFENKWHVDIGWANYRQLVDSGVKPEHINAPPTCTACQIDTYFSFRKDSKESFGEIMGVIGFKQS